jgi:hypothetical protein
MRTVVADVHGDAVQVFTTCDFDDRRTIVLAVADAYSTPDSFARAELDLDMVSRLLTALGKAQRILMEGRDTGPHERHPGEYTK